MFRRSTTAKCKLSIDHYSSSQHANAIPRYVPLANWLLMIGTVLIAGIFNNTTALGNAYGVCVMFVTFFDTCMVTLAAIFVWKFSPFLVFLPWLTIALMDGAFLSSVLTKVPQGAVSSHCARHPVSPRKLTLVVVHDNISCPPRLHPPRMALRKRATMGRRSRRPLSHFPLH